MIWNLIYLFANKNKDENASLNAYFERDWYELKIKLINDLSFLFAPSKLNPGAYINSRDSV